MYLYISEGGEEVFQYSLPPTATDLLSIEAGTLRVLVLDSGKFEELNPDKTTAKVPYGDRFTTAEGDAYTWVNP